MTFGEISPQKPIQLFKIHSEHGCKIGFQWFPISWCVHATQTGQFSEKSHHECRMKSLYIDIDFFNNVNTKETKNTVQFLEEQLRVRLLLVLGKCETMNIESIWHLVIWTEWLFLLPIWHPNIRLCNIKVYSTDKAIFDGFFNKPFWCCQTSSFPDFSRLRSLALGYWGIALLIPLK